MRKKTICLVTDWYPTKENPFVGSFFKEQAFSLSDKLDFTVLHIKEKQSIFSKFKSIENVNTEKNTIEYEIIIYISIIYKFMDYIYSYFRKKGKNAIDGVGKYTLEIENRKLFNLYRKILEDNRINKFDLLYCVDTQIESYTVWCLSKITNKPYIVSEHAPFPWPGSMLIDRNKKSTEEADAFLAISKDKIRQISMLNVVLPKTYYIGNYVDDSKFRYIPSNNHYKTFIIVASHSYYKNYDMFIKVMNKLKIISKKKFKVIIAGYAANKNYSKNVEELEKKVFLSQFNDCVELIPEISRDDIPKLYNKADAFVFTSIQEGQPIAPLEAACSGLPIFSTRCGGVEDYVTNEIGRIYDIDDVEGMAKDLNRFINNEIRFDNRYIRNRIKKQFGKKKFVESFINIVEETI